MSSKWDVNNAKWLIPNKYPLQTKEQCVELLRLGFTLINNQGYTVYLAKDGSQVMSNARRMNKNKTYDFTHPFFWQVKDTDYARTKLLNWDGWWFKFEVLMLKLGNKFF